MTTFLQRYQRGEREHVWSDLVALGEAVYDDLLYADALAVARETMRRARYNIERLIPRLVSIGYQFGYGWVQPLPETPWSPKSRMDYMDAINWARAHYPVFVPATAREELLSALVASSEHLERLDLGADHLIQQLHARRAAVAARPAMHERIALIERATGKLPLSLVAWYELVGSVNFVGYHHRWMALLPQDPDEACAMRLLDPLVIAPLEASVQARSSSASQSQKVATNGPEEMLQLPTWSSFDIDDPAPVSRPRAWWAANASRAEYRLELATWPRGKYDSGPDDIGLEVRLPQLRADAQLMALPPYDEMTFVEYLRLCFRWGGFPGWAQMKARPVQDLEFLTEGILPV